MSNLLFIDGSVLMKVWAVGFFGLHAGGIIHILPAIAIVAFLIRFLYNKTMLQQY